MTRIAKGNGKAIELCIKAYEQIVAALPSKYGDSARNELAAYRELLEAAIGFIHVDSGAREEDRLAEAITACRGAHA